MSRNTPHLRAEKVSQFDRLIISAQCQHRFSIRMPVRNPEHTEPSIQVDRLALPASCSYKDSLRCHNSQEPSSLSFVQWVSTRDNFDACAGSPRRAVSSYLDLGNYGQFGVFNYGANVHHIDTMSILINPCLLKTRFALRIQSDSLLNYCKLLWVVSCSFSGVTRFSHCSNIQKLH